jgi:hypothetical protein
MRSMMWGWGAEKEYNFNDLDVALLKRKVLKKPQKMWIIMNFSAVLTA